MAYLSCIIIFIEQRRVFIYFTFNIQNVFADEGSHFLGQQRNGYDNFFPIVGSDGYSHRSHRAMIAIAALATLGGFR